MGVWDKTIPPDTAAWTEGDDRIREMKTALEEALSHESSTFPGATPGSTPIFIPGFLHGATGLRPTGDSLVSGRYYCNTTLNIIERYNGAGWDSEATLVPPGTKMFFNQASVPVGWTAVVLNDKFLRVVSGGGTGGTSGGSGLAPSSTISLVHTHTTAHTHSISTQADHTHSLPAGTGFTNSGSPYSPGLANAGSHNHGGATGSQSGDDSKLSNTAFQYANIIVGTKD